MTQAHIEDVEWFARRVVDLARNEHLRLNQAVEKALEEQKTRDEAISEDVGITIQGGPRGFPTYIHYNGVRYIQEPKP